MRYSLHGVVVVVGMVGTLLLLGPGHAEAQILRKIKEQAKAKIDEKVVKKTEERVLERSSQVVDSATEKTARGVDTVVTRSGNAANRAIEGTENVISALVKKDDTDAAIARQLAAGRLVLTEVRFAADGPLDSAAYRMIRRVAKAIGETTGPFLIEGHVGDSAGASAQAISEARARAVKAYLVAEGVAADRLFVMGFGTSRPPAGQGGVDRIEVARMQ